MLTLWGRSRRRCDGRSRRDFLAVGALGAAGLAWPDLLRSRAAAAEADGRRAEGSPKAVILVCLPGGPSHLDTYDLKPDAPTEVRGEFRPIPSNVPGFDLCELFPLQARIADRLAVVRNLQFTQPDHQLHEVFTGYPTLDRRPSLGSVVDRLRQDDPGLLPKYVSLGAAQHPRTVAVAETPTYLGPAHRPFEPTADGLRNLEPRDGFDAARFAERRSLLRTFDGFRAVVDARGDADGVDEFRRRAFDMLVSSGVRDAFDLSREPPHVRAKYGDDEKSRFNYQFGHTWHGSQFLLARRLVEAGVPVVTLGVMGWDHHGNLNGVRGTIFERTREQLPWLDRSLHALVTDLHERGLARDVAVVVWGEFGRTPRINVYGGRDHWPSAGFALFAGGGLRTGQVIGATTPHGERPATKAYRPTHVLATLYRVLGIDPSRTLIDHAGRPRMLLDDATPVGELLA